MRRETTPGDSGYMTQPVSCALPTPITVSTLTSNVKGAMAGVVCFYEVSQRKRKARRSGLSHCAKLVAGTGFEPVTFRL